MVNYWPDMTLDEYIDLKGCVEARMKVSVLTSTGDDNPISLIKQHMVFALVFEDMVRFAVVHDKFFATDCEPLADAVLPLMGLELDKVWEHIVITIGGFEVLEGVTIEEQITIDGEKQKVIKQIESLEKKVRAEKQPRRKYELYQQLCESKKRLE